MEIFNWLFKRLKSSQKNGTSRKVGYTNNDCRRLKYGLLQKELAEALLWRDEEVSLGAIPSPIEEQPDREKYYEDAKYLLDWLNRKFTADGKIVKDESTFNKDGTWNDRGVDRINTMVSTMETWGCFDKDTPLSIKRSIAHKCLLHFDMSLRLMKKR